jgi:type III restriction enzyme
VAARHIHYFGTSMPIQFRIDYRSEESYEPDFVVETNSTMLVCEVKAKAATQHAPGRGKKPWPYLLIPDDQIRGSATLDGLVAKFATS